MILDAYLSSKYKTKNPKDINRTDVFLTDKDKYKYDKGNVKKLFKRYESIGFRQVYAKEEKYRKLYNLAVGKINKEDYIDGNVPNELDFNANNASLDDMELEFYPIIPTIRNAILSEYDKKYIEYSAHAINRENTNTVIESYNNDLRSQLIQKAQNLFLAENPDLTQEEIQLFQESEKITNYYKTEFRTEIEKWANHTIQKENGKFNVKGIERKLLDQILVTEHPVVHIDLTDGYYKPEVLNEKDVFYLKSPIKEDLSESMMVGWYNYSNIGTLLNEEGNIFKEKDLAKLSKWIDNYYDAGFVINDEDWHASGNKMESYETIRNYIQFKNLERSTDSRYNDKENTLIRKTTIYFLLPKKAGKLYYKDGDVTETLLVSDEFKVTDKPIYRDGEEPSQHSLIRGEHVEWFFYNELWRGKKLDLNVNAPNYKEGIDDYESIWLELDRHELQYSEQHMRYGVRIPVHGGPVSDYYNDSMSMVELCAPWQVSYNWVWNRNRVLLATEIGKFLILNQGAIPNESLGETWAKNDLIKWALVGRDTGIAPIDSSLTHMGQSALGVQGGIGEVVDLNKTQDILEKANLALLIKRECYAQVGLTEEYLLGNISARQSGTSVAQGMQRSSNQIQHLYTRLNDVVRNMRITMLETAQYIESKNPNSQISYLTEDGARVIFETNTEGFLLHKLDIHVKNNVSDSNVLEKIKQNMAQTNTLGADTLEMASIEAAKSVPELFHKLTKLKDEKLAEAQKEREFQQKQQEEQINAAREAQDKALAEQREADRLDREKDIMVAQIRSLGYANDDANTISKEIVELQAASAQQKEYYANLEYRDTLAQLEVGKQEHAKEQDRRSSDLDERIKMAEVRQKDRELDIREKEVKAADRRTKAIR